MAFMRHLPRNFRTLRLCRIAQEKRWLPASPFSSRLFSHSTHTVAVPVRLCKVAEHGAGKPQKTASVAVVLVHLQ
eukprot:scaffold1055_cov165-Amphora_coffeaeformis.AAC.1